MTAKISYPATGRGAWPGNGTGGTVKSDGTAPGRFYRSIAAGANLPSVGLAGYRADRLTGGPCTVDEFAVYRGVVAVQVELRERGLLGSDLRPLLADGIWGKNTDSAVRAFQLANNLTPDGVFGPASARALFTPRARSAAQAEDNTGTVWKLMVGTVQWESGWDPGAVGSSTPQDLGLGQINGPAHPSMTEAMRLDPAVSLPYVAGMIAANLRAMKWNPRDAVAAYRYGVRGASEWVAAGRPQLYKGTDAWDYIGTILNGGVRP